MGNNFSDRGAEWFVPRFGPPKLRSFVGLLFLPYTGMVISFSVIGSMLGNPVYWERIPAIVAVYFLGLGIAAHALDALGSKGIRPWGTIFARRQLWVMAISSLVLAYIIALYYAIRYVPFLLSMAFCEGFFVFAYNLEWFHGRFHTDGWFAFSWGFLPALSGYIMQTNKISIEAVAVAVSTSLFSLIEIKASRPYKDLKRRFDTLRDEEKALMKRYEDILKSISIGVIFLGGGLLIWRMVN